MALSGKTRSDLFKFAGTSGSDLVGVSNEALLYAGCIPLLSQAQSAQASFTRQKRERASERGREWREAEAGRGRESQRLSVFKTESGIRPSSFSE